jgi:hypothetical protein
MNKVLYICNIGQIPAQQHIIDFLREKDIEVYVEEAGGWETLKFENTHFIYQHVNRKYDFIIFNAHYDEAPMKAFFTSVRPRIGFIDVSHDLLEQALPHIMRPYRVEGDSAVLLFHKVHRMAAELYFSNYRTLIRSRWYKLDMDYSPISDARIDKWNDAIMIGNHLKPYRDLLVIPEGFRKIWYKQKFDEDVVEGTEMLPAIYNGPQGLRQCADSCKFALSSHSSALIESLLFGQIPIFLPGFYKEQKKLNDVISIISIADFNGVRAITSENLAHKLTILRDEQKFKEIHNNLYSQWFEDSYLELPSAHEVIWKFMKAASGQYKNYNIPDLLKEIKELKEQIHGRN